jgi:hypothetical protein
VALASKPGQATAQAAAQESIATVKLPTIAASEGTVRSGIAQFASALPTLFGQLIRRSTIAQVRGVSAYQLAQARNAANRQAVAAEAN